MTSESRGGFVSGPSAEVRIERVGRCVHGHWLYRFNAGPLEHVISAEEIKAGDLRQARCGETRVSGGDA